MGLYHSASAPQRNILLTQILKKWLARFPNLVAQDALWQFGIEH